MECKIHHSVSDVIQEFESETSSKLRINTILLGKWSHDFSAATVNSEESSRISSSWEGNGTQFWSVDHVIGGEQEWRPPLLCEYVNMHTIAEALMFW